MPNILIFGAGNIGRAFIGQVFSKNGYDVVFADIQEEVIHGLNERKSYPVVIRAQGQSDRIITVSHVSGISVLDKDAIIEQIRKADILATSVGMNAIPHIAPLIAQGLMERINHLTGPIDLILAENIHNGRELLLNELKKHLPPDLNIEKELGIVQSSIGKMVPIVTNKDKAKDSLLVASEEYNELILDAHAFLNPIPECPEINAVHPIEAYSDRKIYIHNLGHAVTAYLGFKSYPEETLIAEILSHNEILDKVRSAMRESASALIKLYPQSFNLISLDAYIEDLLVRFQNRALGDSVFRVGRDLSRKLHRDDRILGAIRNCENHDLPWGHIADAFFAAFEFKACDESGHYLDADNDFLAALNATDESFIQLCALDNNDPIDIQIIKKLLERNIKS